MEPAYLPDGTIVMPEETITAAPPPMILPEDTIVGAPPDGGMCTGPPMSVTDEGPAPDPSAVPLDIGVGDPQGLGPDDGAIFMPPETIYGAPPSPTEDTGAGGAPGWDPFATGAEGAGGAPPMGPSPPESVDITLLDQREHKEWNDANEGSVGGFTNPAEAVERAKAAAAGRPIHDLDIIDHGAPGYQTMGDKGIFYAYNPDTAPYDDTMSRLRGDFAPDGQVRLRGCTVGAGPQGSALLSRTADQTGVPTSAGIETQYPSMPGTDPEATGPFQGPVKGCLPSYSTEYWTNVCGITDSRTKTSYLDPALPDPERQFERESGVCRPDPQVSSQ